MSSRAELIEFLSTIARSDRDVWAVGDEDDLVEASIIDSLAIIQIIMYLENVHQLDVSSIDPTRLGTIAGILSVIDR